MTGEWAFMYYQPKGCEPITDCHKSIHRYENVVVTNRYWKVYETKEGEGCTEEDKEEKLATMLTFKSKNLWHIKKVGDPLLDIHLHPYKWTSEDKKRLEIGTERYNHC